MEITKSIEDIKVRIGTMEDIPPVFALVKELAVYEKAPHEVENSIEQMKKDGFGENPLYGFIVAEKANKIIGVSLYYNRYSTWKGKMLYLEDLIVTEEFRNCGIGKRLFDATIAQAKITACRGLIWEVLEWNEPAFRFYRKYQPVIDPQWVVCRMTKEQLDNYIPVS